MARQPRRFDREDDAEFAKRNKKGERRVRMPSWDEIVAQTSEGGSPLIRGATQRVEREEDVEFAKRNKKGERRVKLPPWEQIERENRPGIPGALDETLYPSDVDDVGFEPGMRQRARQYKKQRPHPMRDFEASPQTREQIKEARRTGFYGDELLDYVVTNTSNPPRPRAVRAGYDPQSQQLRVLFRDSDVYVYHGVEPDIWEELKHADSFGKTLERLVVHSKEYEWEGRSVVAARPSRNVQYWDQRRWNATQNNTVEQGSWDDLGR